MRLTTFPVEESDLRFDFSAAVWCNKHDAANTVFDGVDFVIKEAERRIWLEVKNWEGASLPARRRGGQRRSFLAKLNSKAYFTQTLRAKFVGTCAYLALTDNPPREPILYVALLESPRMDSALMLHATMRLRGLVRRDRWRYTVNAVVLNVAEWNERFPDFPVGSI